MGIGACLRRSMGGGLAADELGDLDVLGDAEFFVQPDAVVVGVELVPGEAVAAGGGMGVMVVVPSFAAGEESDPPGVAGVVLGVETAGTVEVGGGVDEPGCVKAKRHAQEDAPEEEADADLDAAGEGAYGDEGDRKSTRLNSSHL